MYLDTSLTFFVQILFSRSVGMRRARTKKGLWHDHFYGKTVPTSYRTPKSIHPIPKHPVQNIDYYIDLGFIFKRSNFEAARRQDSLLFKKHFKLLLQDFHAFVEPDCWQSYVPATVKNINNCKKKKNKIK